jgi:hypothetical protein
MSTCRVSDDEKEHGRKQSKTDDRIEALESTLKMVAQEEFQKELESESRIDFLGFDSFTPLYPVEHAMSVMQSSQNKVCLKAVNEVFVMSVLHEDWSTAAAVVLTKAVLDEADQELLDAVFLEDLRRVQTLLSERCTERYEQILERVTDNWSDYE